MKRYSLMMLNENLKDLNLDTSLPEGYYFKNYSEGDLENWQEIETLAGEFEDISKARARFLEEFGDFEDDLKSRCFFLYDDKDEAIGTAMGWYGDFEGERIGRIHWISIKPSHQGKGLGKPLVAKALERLAQSHDRAYLTSQTTSWKAVKIYYAFGFKPVIVEPEGTKPWELLLEKLKPDLHAYLKRIGYDKLPDKSLESLSEIQYRHFSTVPYENFDILAGIPLSLEIPDLLKKIVYEGRGGYCFELNELYKWLLEELGYTTTSMFARFWRDEGNPPPKRRHHVLKVELDGDYYLCDVGVGGIVPKYPVKMVEGLEQKQDDELYRLDKDDYYGWILSEYKDGKWRWIYSFTEEPQLQKDFIMATFWCENSPDSIFTQNVMVARRTPEGRNSVAGREFKIFKGDDVKTFVAKDREKFVASLKEHFNLDISSIAHLIVKLID